MKKYKIELVFKSEVEAENEEAAKMIANENVIFSSYDEAEVLEIKEKKNKMTKKEIADLLIKKQSINNISELHDLFCSNEDIKNNNVRAYSWDCKTCGAEDIRCDLNGLVQTGDDPEFISIKDNNFWDGCEQRNDPNYE
tara:strand:- start:400 stop:816 length:417 start_codon:yes stop_codon:yes gene_type:complete